jgi:hypothetical protein
VATPANALVRQISTSETAKQELRECRSSKYSRDLFDIVASFEVLASISLGQEGGGSLGAALQLVNAEVLGMVVQFGPWWVLSGRGGSVLRSEISDLRSQIREVTEVEQF